MLAGLKEIQAKRSRTRSIDCYLDGDEPASPGSPSRTAHLWQAGGHTILPARRGSWEKKQAAPVRAAIALRRRPRVLVALAVAISVFLGCAALRLLGGAFSGDAAAAATDVIESAASSRGGGRGGVARQRSPRHVSALRNIWSNAKRLHRTYGVRMWAAMLTLFLLLMFLVTMLITEVADTIALGDGASKREDADEGEEDNGGGDDDRGGDGGADGGGGGGGGGMDAPTLVRRTSAGARVFGAAVREDGGGDDGGRAWAAPS